MDALIVTADWFTQLKAALVALVAAAALVAIGLTGNVPTETSHRAAIGAVSGAIETIEVRPVAPSVRAPGA